MHNALERQAGDTRRTSPDTSWAQKPSRFDTEVTLEEEIKYKIKWMDNLLRE
jgi:hypothetical protein